MGGEAVGGEARPWEARQGHGRRGCGRGGEAMGGEAMGGEAVRGPRSCDPEGRPAATGHSRAGASSARVVGGFVELPTEGAGLFSSSADFPERSLIGVPDPDAFWAHAPPAASGRSRLLAGAPGATATVSARRARRSHGLGVCPVCARTSGRRRPGQAVWFPWKLPNGSQSPLSRFPQGRSVLMGAG